MTKFRIHSDLSDNLCLIANEEITNSPCTIHINKTKSFEIPLILAVASSKIIAQQLFTDVIKRDFYFEIPELKDISNEFISKLKEVMQFKEINFENYEELINFSFIGKAIGNLEFCSPLIMKYQELENTINKENCISILRKKIALGFERKEYEKEISFIAHHFPSLKEELRLFFEDTINEPLLEEILINDELVLNNEDELLEFIISLSRKNIIYELNFQYVWFEYCSIDSIELLLKYISERFITNQNEQSLFACISRRLIQPKLPIIDEQIQKRYLNIENWIKVDDVTDNLKGIFYQENIKENLMVDSPHPNNQNPYVLFNADVTAHYVSQNIQNAFIEVSLKNKKLFIIKKYMIRGHKYDGAQFDRLQDWKLEGKQYNDDKWILLDEHSQEPIQKLETKVFEVNCDTPLVSVRLTQTDLNTRGENYIILNGFDVFGLLMP